MFYYKFANTYMGINYNMVDFQSFSIDKEYVDTTNCIIVEFLETEVQKCKKQKVFSNDTINIYSIKDTIINGWLIEDILERGFILVSTDYKRAIFSTSYARTNSGYYEMLKFLLRLVIQCRMVYSGLLILHSACIQIKGNAVCFSGPSGIGKSTRARLWIDREKATWISGDRPAIDPEQGIAYGVPWDGKEQIHLNVNYPIFAIFQVNRSAKTYIKDLTTIQKYEFLSSQLFIPMWDIKLTTSVFSGIKKLINNVKICDLYCDITEKSYNEVNRMFFD